MNSNNEICEYCRCGWNSAFGSQNCPMCDLMVKIDEHIEAVLLQILTTHYSKYIFEIDDKTAAWNREIGFSFRIDRKHNLTYLRILENINHKNTYLLMASHIESAFNDIEQAYKITYGKNPSNVNSSTSLFSYFVSKIKENNINDTFFKDIKKIRVVNFVRLITNTIKHKNSIITKASELGKMLKIKKNIALEEVWDINIPGLRGNLKFGETCAIVHYVRRFLLELGLKLMPPSSIPKLRNITLLNTLNLFRVKLRKNISDEILNSIHNDGIMILASTFFKKANDTKLFFYLKEKIATLERLFKINPKYVVALETGIGIIPDSNPKIWRKVSKLNDLIFDMHRNKTKKIIQYKMVKKIYLKVLDKLVNKFDRDTISDLVWNEFDRIDKRLLPSLIIDYYKEIYALGKKDASQLIRTIGGTPFRKWNPFNFNT